MRIGFLGLSHLSINYAAAAAEKGFSVVCYDPDDALVEKSKKLDLHYSEPGLLELLEKNRSRMQYSSNAEDLKACDLLYIAKDVPTDSEGNSDLSNINLLFDVATSVASSSATIIILCQVPPGYTRKLSFDKERLFYQVETLVFGQAVERALYPERYMVGCKDPSQKLPQALQEFLNKFDCPIFEMRYESAELAKISINLFLISSVVTTNTIAEICEKIGADWGEIQDTLKCDKRIGKYAYLKPGLGLSGGNLERDLTTTLNISYAYGSKSSVITSWMDDCKYRRDWVLRKLYNDILPNMPNPRIGILGISYKPNTVSIKNSPSVYVMEQIKKFPIIAFDPVVKEAPCREVQIVDTAEAACNVDVLIIMTPWEEFRKINFEALSHVKALIDPYNVLQPSNATNQKYNYYCIGRS